MLFRSDGQLNMADQSCSAPHEMERVQKQHKGDGISGMFSAYDMGGGLGSLCSALLWQLCKGCG